MHWLIFISTPKDHSVFLFQVVKLDAVIKKVDIVITASGNKSVVTRAHMDNMKTGCIGKEIGYSFDLCS